MGQDFEQEQTEGTESVPRLHVSDGGLPDLTWQKGVLKLEAVGRGGRPEGEWIASRVREAAQCIDNLIGTTFGHG